MAKTRLAPGGSGHTPASGTHDRSSGFDGCRLGMVGPPLIVIAADLARLAVAFRKLDLVRGKQHRHADGSRARIARVRGNWLNGPWQ